MAKADVLFEQTEFLLDKQKEVLALFKQEFADFRLFLEDEQKKAESVKAGEQLEAFQSVFSMLSEQEDDAITQLEEDITFLGEQLTAVREIQGLGDDERADELTGMLLEEDHELPETAQFKADIEQEAEEAKAAIKAVVHEMRSMFAEEGVLGLESLLQAYADARAQECADCCERAAEEGLCDEELCREDPASCSACKGCNIFEGLEPGEDETE